MPSRVGDFFSAFRGFEADARKLVIVSVLAAVGDATIWFALTLYLNFLGYSKVELGYVIFLMSICAVLPLLPAGYLSDRFGRRRMIFLGVCVCVVGMGVLVRANSLVHFYLGASIWGFGHAIYAPSLWSFLSEKVEDERCKFLFSFQRFAQMIASAITVLIIGFMPTFLGQSFSISVQNSYRIIFFIGLLFFLWQLLPLLLTKKESRKVAHVPKEKMNKPLLPPIPRVRLLKLCIPMALLGLGAGLVVPFFLVYFQWRFSTSVEGIGILFALTQFLWAFAYLLMPKFAERKGSVRAITMVHIVAIFALLAIPASPTFFFVSIAYITRMVLMNSTWPIFQSYSLSQMPKEHRSFTLSATNFSFNGPKAITPLIAGYIFEHSLGLPFLLTAGFYTVSTTAFYLFFRGRDDKRVVEDSCAPPTQRDDDI